MTDHDTDDTDNDEPDRNSTQDAPTVDATQPATVDWIALSRIPRVLGNDEEESEQTLNSYSQYVAEGEHMGSDPDPNSTASDVLYRFEKSIEKGYVPAEVANLVAGRLIEDYGDEMTADERKRVRWLGDECVLTLAESYDRKDRKLRERRPFEGVDLSTVDYIKLSNSKEREFFREKARQIRTARRDNSDTEPAADWLSLQRKVDRFRERKREAGWSKVKIEYRLAQIQGKYPNKKEYINRYGAHDDADDESSTDTDK